MPVAPGFCDSEEENLRGVNPLLVVDQGVDARARRT